MAKQKEVDLSYIMAQLNNGYIDITDSYGERLEFEFVKNAVIEYAKKQRESLITS